MATMVINRKVIPRRFQQEQFRGTGRFQKETEAVAVQRKKISV
jgi:hypothetical protein